MWRLHSLVVFELAPKKLVGRERRERGNSPPLDAAVRQLDFQIWQVRILHQKDLQNESDRPPNRIPLFQPTFGYPKAKKCSRAENSHSLHLSLEEGNHSKQCYRIEADSCPQGSGRDSSHCRALALQSKNNRCGQSPAIVRQNRPHTSWLRCQVDEDD